MPEYESIFWEPQWVHAAYYGWREVHRERDLVIFKKQTWGLQRFLALTKDSSEQALAKQLRRLVRPLWRSELVIHNFDQELARPQKVGTVCLEPLGESSRLLNQQTFVIDLGKEISVLQQAMTGDCRRKCRKAAEHGAVLYEDPNPPPEVIRRFIEQYRQMAKQRHLQIPSQSLLRKMYRNGRLVHFSAVISGECQSDVLIYHCSNKAIFLYGVSEGKTNNGVGQFLHWGIVESLKARGLRWYDLGGIASTSEQDGIYRFKKSFGGELISLGSETGYRSPLFRALRWLRKFLP